MFGFWNLFKFAVMTLDGDLPAGGGEPSEPAAPDVTQQATEMLSKATDPAPAAPVTPPAATDDPEFEIEPGKKYKRSDLLGWQKAHESAESLKPLAQLDAFLSQQGNEALSDAIIKLIHGHRVDPSKSKAVLELLEGKAAAAQNAPVAPAQPDPMEEGLDLSDPSIKKLFGVIKGLQTKLGELEGFKTETVKEAEARKQQEALKEAEARWRQQTDEQIKKHKFVEDLASRLPETDREEYLQGVKARLMFLALNNPNQLPLDQVAKTLFEREARWMNGLLKQYVDSKKAAPPQGGSGRSVTTPPKPPKNDDELHTVVMQTLAESQAAREGI